MTNKILLKHNSRSYIMVPVGTEDFETRWKNFVYNFIPNRENCFHLETEKEFLRTPAIPYPHFLVNKETLWEKLRFSILTQIRMRYRNLTKQEQETKIDKVFNFYKNRVFRTDS